MRHWIVMCCGALWAVQMVMAQTDALIVENTQTVARLDAFGLEQVFAEGTLLNQGSDAYANISLLAEVYDADDNLIGEGLGYLVRACGEALVADFTLQPGQHEIFSAQLDMFEPGTAIGRVDIIPQAEAVAPLEQSEPAEFPGVSQVSDAEVVEVEWIDGDNLRFSAGCWRNVYTNRDWYTYNLSGGITEPAAHPQADTITGQMRETIRLGDPMIFNRSFFSFAPGGRRAAYQTDLNTLVTIEPDGTFQRVLYEALFNITLQGINWHKNSGTFLAYYHGGYGDEVMYLVANADGRQFSQHPTAALTSRIVPGFAANGRGVVIATTSPEGVTGYFLKPTTTDQLIPMFEADPPGNNWPAPFYEITEAGDRWIYIVRPVEGEARLQCYNPDSQQLHDYTALPLELATDERGWTWLSPDNRTLALAANGVNGGLWLIDLTQFPPCA